MTDTDRLAALLREELDDHRPWVSTMAARLIAKGVHIGVECPYCSGQMCARFDGLNCQHDDAERHGYEYPRPAPDATLDVAWAEAEAALPEGWRIYSVHRDIRQDRGFPEAWSVIAHTAADGYHATIAVHDRRGTLVDALAALKHPTQDKLRWEMTV